MLTLKDYIALTLSAFALCFSLYNYYESRRDARAAKIRTIERKRFEETAILSAIIACKLRSEAALAAVRFEAQMAGNAEVERTINERLSSVRESISYYSNAKQEQTNLIAKSVKAGSFEGLLAAEKFVGLMKDCQARADEDEIREANLIAEFRRVLLAAS